MLPCLTARGYLLINNAITELGHLSLTHTKWSGRAVVASTVKNGLVTGWNRRDWVVAASGHHESRNWTISKDIFLFSHARWRKDDRWRNVLVMRSELSDMWWCKPSSESESDAQYCSKSFTPRNDSSLSRCWLMILMLWVFRLCVLILLFCCPVKQCRRLINGRKILSSLPLVG